MTDSTARAERLDLQSSSSPCYIWEVPQKPVAVRFSFPLIDRLEHEAVESFRSLSSRGSEIGGLLLGSVSPGNPALVTIEEYELMVCDYSRGPLYRLSDADMGRFDEAIERHSARVAGYFRSHTRKGLSFDADDLAFFDPRFRAAHHIALLIRPFAAKASTGGIFIREGGVIRGEASYLEFPLRSSELKPSLPGGEAGNGRGAAAPPPAAAKPAVRAQIVPIAPRREAGAPPSPPPAETPAAIPAAVATPAPAPPKPAPAAAPAKPTPAPAPAKPAPPAAQAKAAQPAPGKPAQPAAPAKPAPPATAARVEEKAPAAPAREKARPAAPAAARPDKSFLAADLLDTAEKPQGSKLWMIGAAAAGLLLIVLLFVYPGFLRHSTRTPAAAPHDSSPLALRVERTSGGLLLTWNRDSDAIKNATHATLSINDGERHENSNMDLNLLRSGSIVYSPLTGNVSFLMEVTGRDKSKTTTDALQFLDTRPSPVDGTPAPQQAANPSTPANPQADAANGAAAATTEAANPVEEAKPANATPAKPFNRDSLSQRLRPARPEDLPDAPAVGQSPAATAPSVLGGLTPPPAMQAPPVSTSAPAAAPPAPKQPAAVKTGGKFQEAVLTYRKDPEFPKLARQAGARGQVVLAATIGADGRVKGVKAVSGNAMLRQAAIDAVMQWRYKPALLNGVQVDSPASITLNFAGDR